MVWAQMPAACSRHAAEAAEAAPRARGSLRCALSVFAPMKGPTYPDKVPFESGLFAHRAQPVKTPA